jgi:hypothetical protein
VAVGDADRAYLRAVEQAVGAVVLVYETTTATGAVTRQQAWHIACVMFAWGALKFGAGGSAGPPELAFAGDALEAAADRLGLRVVEVQ